MMRAFHLGRIALFFVVPVAAAALAPSAQAQHGGGGMHGGGMGGGGFHGGGGGFHGDGHFHGGGCCFFGFGFGGFGWAFSYGYAPGYYGGYPYGAPYPYYPPAYYPPPYYSPGVATPPVAPGAYSGPSMPPSGPTSFAVYFGTGSAQLSTAAHNVIQRAAAAEAHVRAQIAVAGFTDAAGSGTRNLDLSRRRAESVREALIAAGVPDQAIALVWHGEDGLQVPTQDGVAAAENRRVVILVGAPPPPVS